MILNIFKVNYNLMSYDSEELETFLIEAELIS